MTGFYLQALLPETAWDYRHALHNAYIPLRADERLEMKRAYQRAVQSGGSQFLSLRVMFIGAGRIGKTSTKNFLRNKPFQANERSTNGVQVSDCKVTRERVLQFKSGKLVRTSNIKGSQLHGNNP